MPVLASNVGGVPDRLADGELGVLVPPGDIQSLATGLVELLTAPALRSAPSARATLAARQNIFHTMVDAIEKVDVE